MKALPHDLLLDGELVAWAGSEPCFPLLCRRVLNRDSSVHVTFVVFDLLRRNGVDLTDRPYDERRIELVGLGLDGPAWTTIETFDDDRALEGIVAKSHASLYRAGERGWINLKNRATGVATRSSRRWAEARTSAAKSCLHVRPRY